MKHIVLAAGFILACAANHADAPARSRALAESDGSAAARAPTRPDASTESGAQQKPNLHWSPEERESVRLQCQAQIGAGQFCDCLTSKLETISPDPDTELTHEDIRAGLQACRTAAPQPGDTGT